MLKSHVVLIGLRGSGKTTIGRLLARRLGGGFVDLDDRTPRVLGAVSVAEAWTAHGESGFRVGEVTALAEVMSEPACVVALGGGTPTAPGAAELLRGAVERGVRVVYLRAMPETLARRLSSSNNAHRPALTGHTANSIEEVRKVFAARDGAYRGIAADVVECDGVRVDEVVNRVAKLVGGER